MSKTNGLADRASAVALVMGVMVGWLGASARGGVVDAEMRARGRAVADRAIGFLRERQGESGGWAVPAEGSGAPVMPAISALVLTGMLMDPGIDHTDAAVGRGVEFVLSYRRGDGGIYGVIGGEAGAGGVPVLPNYNTSICVSMLSLVRTGEAGSAVAGGVGLVRALQWQDGEPSVAADGVPAESVGREHPYYGGWGYGSHGRPDISNTQFALQALHDAGVSSEDPAVKRGLVFLERVQMHGSVNSMPYARGSEQGGFIYATVPDSESIDGVPGQSQAGEFEEVLGDGSRRQSLRAYGSVSYAGLKSLIYADLARDDARVRLAREWLSRNYTLEENPGLGQQGYYYYVLAMSRALAAWGEPEVEVVVGGPAGGERAGPGVGEVVRRRWAHDLIEELERSQQGDGSFRVRHARWMEDNAELITAYGLVALQAAME